MLHRISGILCSQRVSKLRPFRWRGGFNSKGRPGTSQSGRDLRACACMHMHVRVRRVGGVSSDTVTVNHFTNFTCVDTRVYPAGRRGPQHREGGSEPALHVGAPGVVPATSFREQTRGG